MRPERRYALGVATDYDVFAGKVDVENARPALIRTENLIQIAQERFRFLLGIGEQEVDAQGKPRNRDCRLSQIRRGH